MRAPNTIAATLLLAVCCAAQESRPESAEPLPRGGQAVVEKATDRVRLQDIPIPSDQQGREVLELTLEDALRIGNAQNIDLRADELVPQEQRQSLRVEEAFFEPEFFASARTSEATSPSRNVFQPSIKRETVSGQIGFRQRVATGGSFELSFAPSRLRQNTDTPGFPNRQFTSSLVATITQPILRGAWSDYALRNVHGAQAEFVGARFRFERQIQEKLIEIVRAYWELAFARNDYRVVYQAVELARERLRITNERIRLRDLPARDRIADEADVARRREEAIRAENTIAQREDELRRLLFDGRERGIWERNLRPISAFEGEFEPLAADWRALARQALRVRPDILSLRADMRVAEIEHETAKRDLLPQLDLVGSYGADGVRENFPNAFEDSTSLEFPEWSIELQLSVPIGNNAARANRDRAEFALERARRRLYAAELDVDREIRDGLRDLGSLSEAVTAARESVRLAENVLDTAREVLRVGRGTNFEVQERSQELLDARQRLLRNELDYHIARANLAFARGILAAAVDEGADDGNGANRSR